MYLIVYLVASYQRLPPLLRVFLNATAIFFRFNLPLRYLKRGFLLLALTNLFHAESLRLGVVVRLGERAPVDRGNEKPPSLASLTPSA